MRAEASRLSEQSSYIAEIVSLDEKVLDEHAHLNPEEIVLSGLSSRYKALIAQAQMQALSDLNGPYVEKLDWLSVYQQTLGESDSL